MPEFDSATDALDYLEELGTTHAISLAMESRGITALPGCPESCAVALFIVNTTEAFSVSLASESGEVWVYDPDAAFHTYHEVLVFGPLVRQFIYEFDARKFPNLVRQTSVSGQVFA